jgi:hypothetical protein
MYSSHAATPNVVPDVDVSAAPAAAGLELEAGDGAVGLFMLLELDCSDEAQPTNRSAEHNRQSKIKLFILVFSSTKVVPPKRKCGRVRAGKCDGCLKSRIWSESHYRASRSPASNSEFALSIDVASE